MYVNTESLHNVYLLPKNAHIEKTNACNLNFIIKEHQVWFKCKEFMNFKNR